MALPATPTPNPQFTNVYETVRRSIVKVETPSGVGTGWVFQEGWVLTAEHVVSGLEQATIHYVDSNGSVKILIGQVTGFDRLRDLAVIKVPIGLPAIPIRTITRENIAEQVMTVGYSSGQVGFPSVRVGVITTIVEVRGVEVVGLETDADVDAGDSGGPMLDLDGNVVGINQATMLSNASGQRILGRQKSLLVTEAVEVWEKLKETTINSTQEYWWRR